MTDRFSIKGGLLEAKERAFLPIDGGKAPFAESISKICLNQIAPGGIMEFKSVLKIASPGKGRRSSPENQGDGRNDTRMGSWKVIQL